MIRKSRYRFSERPCSNENSSPRRRLAARRVADAFLDQLKPRVDVFDALVVLVLHPALRLHLFGRERDLRCGAGGGGAAGAACFSGRPARAGEPAAAAGPGPAGRDRPAAVRPSARYPPNSSLRRSLQATKGSGRNQRARNPDCDHPAFIAPQRGARQRVSGSGSLRACARSGASLRRAGRACSRFSSRRTPPAR